MLEKQLSTEFSPLNMLRNDSQDRAEIYWTTFSRSEPIDCFLSFLFTKNLLNFFVNFL